MLVDHLQKTKKEFKNSKKQEIKTIFTKMNFIKACFQHDIKHLMLQKILTMMDIKDDWVLWFTHFLIKS